MRCFLAVPLEEPALGAAAGLVENARREHPGVRWARPDGLHLTLHFFGSIDAGSAGAMLALVGPASAEHGPFDLHLDHLGCFPERGPARVLWLGPGEGRERLAELAARCHQLLGSAGVALDDRPYAPHCTLGRVRRSWPASAAASWSARRVIIPAFRARRMVLYESVSAPGGAVYIPRGEVELAGPSAA